MDEKLMYSRHFRVQMSSQHRTPHNGNGTGLSNAVSPFSRARVPLNETTVNSLSAIRSVSQSGIRGGSHQYPSKSTRDVNLSEFSLSGYTKGRYDRFSKDNSIPLRTPHERVYGSGGVASSSKSDFVATHQRRPTPACKWGTQNQGVKHLMSFPAPQTSQKLPNKKGCCQKEITRCLPLVENLGSPMANYAPRENEAKKESGFGLTVSSPRPPLCDEPHMSSDKTVKHTMNPTSCSSVADSTVQHSEGKLSESITSTIPSHETSTDTPVRNLVRRQRLPCHIPEFIRVPLPSDEQHLVRKRRLAAAYTQLVIEDLCIESYADGQPGSPAGELHESNQMSSEPNGPMKKHSARRLHTFILPVASSVIQQKDHLI